MLDQLKLEEMSADEIQTRGERDKAGNPDKDNEIAMSPVSGQADAAAVDAANGADA